MKRIATLLTLLPAASFAHGAHAPVAESSHGLVHLAPALAVIVLAAGVAWLARGRDASGNARGRDDA